MWQSSGCCCYSSKRLSSLFFSYCTITCLGYSNGVTIEKGTLYGNRITSKTASGVFVLGPDCIILLIELMNILTFA